MWQKCRIARFIASLIHWVLFFFFLLDRTLFFQETITITINSFVSINKFLIIAQSSVYEAQENEKCDDWHIFQLGLLPYYSPYSPMDEIIQFLNSHFSSHQHFIIFYKILKSAHCFNEAQWNEKCDNNLFAKHYFSYWNIIIELPIIFRFLGIDLTFVFGLSHFFV